MKESNNKENYFAEASYHFASANYSFVDANWEKPILHWHSLVEAKKSELQGLINSGSSFKN